MADLGPWVSQSNEARRAHSKLVIPCYPKEKPESRLLASECHTLDSVAIADVAGDCHAIKELQMLRLRTRLTEKLPEILIEAGSVFLALLLAFAASAWHQHHQRVALATRAHAAIVDEMMSNRRQLEQSVAQLKKSEHLVRGRLKALAHKPPDSISYPYRPWLPSSAAWRSAQASGAVRSFNYEWMLKVARVYRRQELFLYAQRQLMSPTMPAVVPGMQKRGSAARKTFYGLLLGHMLAAMQNLAGTGANLQDGYAAVLDDASSPAPALSAGSPVGAGTAQARSRHARAVSPADARATSQARADAR